MDYQDPVWNGHNMSFTANLMYGQSESHILNTIDRHDVHVDEVCSEDSGLPKCSSFPLICAQPSPGA